MWRLIIAFSLICPTVAAAGSWLPGPFAQGAIANGDYITDDDGRTKLTATGATERRLGYSPLVWTQEGMVDYVLTDLTTSHRVDLRTGIGLGCDLPYDMVGRLDVQIGMYEQSDVSNPRPEGLIRFGVGKGFGDERLHHLIALDGTVLIRAGPGPDEAKLDLTYGAQRGHYALYLQMLSSRGIDEDWATAKSKLMLAWTSYGGVTFAFGGGQTVARHNSPAEQFLSASVWRSF